MSIWLDVTTILNWERPAVGIIRVESECARQLLSTTEDRVLFCCFDFAANRYVAVDRDRIAVALRRLSTAGPLPYRPDSAAGPSDPDSTGSREDRVKHSLLTIVNRLPERSREALLRFIRPRKDVFFGLVRALREIRSALRALINASDYTSGPTHPAPRAAPQSRDQSAIFAPGDVYVAMGLDWADKSLEYLYQLKGDIGFKVILFCYDIIPVRFPHLCAGDVSSIFAEHFANAARCADRMLCISECSRRDLSDFLSELGVPVPEISVVPLGSERRCERGQQPAADVTDVLRRPYILFVSTIERRKNHDTLYRAYARLLEEGATNIPILVLVGMPGWGVSDLLSNLRLDPRIQSSIRMLNCVSDADLGHLYEGAEFTVFPSLYEGWGLPVAESLAYGKFCLASNAASIPEAGGALIEYLDPWDVAGWAQRLKWYFDHPEAVREKEDVIRREYRPTRWSDTAACVLTAATQVASSHCGEDCR
jgi:glycosyltransferase involved in cell wall biosynthesis